MLASVFLIAAVFAPVDVPETGTDKAALVDTAMWTSGRRRGADGFDVLDGDDDGILWLGNNLRFTTSRNFEAYAQGLEDVAYVDRLKKELARRSKGAFPDCEKLVDDYFAQTRKPDATEIDAWRLAVGRAIRRLGENE